MKQSRTNMNRRQKRLTTIAGILLNNIIGSQEELLSRLVEGGYNITQATLSRDLKTLRTSKVATELGGYRYVIGNGLPGSKEIEQATVERVSRAAVIEVTLSGQLLVVKTRNGYAGGVAYDIDDLDCPHFMGTIAGADTVFVALRAGAPPAEVHNALLTIMPAEVLADISSEK